MYDRMVSMRESLGHLVGTGASREEVLKLLRNGLTEADKQLPEDDLRIMDDMVFHGAIATFDKNREAAAEAGRGTETCK